MVYQESCGMKTRIVARFDITEFPHPIRSEVVLDVTGAEYSIRGMFIHRNLNTNVGIKGLEAVASAIDETFQEGEGG